MIKLQQTNNSIDSSTLISCSKQNTLIIYLIEKIVEKTVCISQWWFLFYNKEQMKIFQTTSREAIQTFIGTAMIKFATGIIGTWGTINLYFISYLKNHGTEVSSRTNSILMLFIVIPTSFLVLLATKFASYIGYERIIKLCALLFTFVPLLLNISLNFVTLGVFFLFVPMMCFAISAIPIINCLWSEFPKDLNKVSGFAILFFSLGMIVWNIVFFKIVNPDNKQAVIDSNGEAYFTDQITDNVITAVNWIFIIAGTFYIAGSFLIHKREEKKVIEELKEEEFQEGTEEEEKKEEDVKDLIVEFAPDKRMKKGLLATLKDKKFILLFIIAYFIPLYLVYLVLFMKIIFMPIINDDRYLAMCSVVLTVAGMIGGPLWGFIADKKGFKKTLLLVCITDLITKVIGLQCTQKWNIIIMYFMVGFNDRGIITIIGPGLIEIFGLDMATELVPYKGFSVFLAYLTVPLFQMTLNGFMTYTQILCIFILLTVIAVYLAYYFYTKVNYIPFEEHHKKSQTKELQSTPEMGSQREEAKDKKSSDEVITSAVS